MSPSTPVSDRRDQPVAKTRRRVCAGCRAETDPSDRIRLVLDAEERLVVDLAGKAFGRGCWVHPRLECLRAVLRGGAARAFKRPVHAQLADLADAIDAAADRRIAGLLASSRSSGQLAVGAEACQHALQQHPGALLLVARDGRAQIQQSWVDDTVAQGRAVAWGDKARFGQVAGRETAALMAVTEPKLALEVRRCVQLCGLTVDIRCQAPVKASRRTSGAVEV